VNVQHRQSLIEPFERLFWAVDTLNRPIPMRCKARRVADGEKRVEFGRVALLPRFADDFRPDPRRIARRYGERQGTDIHQQLCL
jgi:hypothetical protein